MTDTHEDSATEIDDGAGESARAPSLPAATPALRAVILRPWLHGLLLVSLVWLCFARSLTSYFLADDFGEIAYVYRICQGDPQLLWSNFTGNYMQIPGMAVWRPWLLMTLVFDFAIWKANACGYYLTNLVFYCGDVLLLYAIGRIMTRPWQPWRSVLAATYAAALFAVNPLHCESVTWVVGRVDIISCFFYLAGFLLVLRQRESPGRFALPAAVACFWLGLWTKEMAIGLPVLVTALGFLWPDGQAAGGSTSLKERAASALRLSRLFWLSTVVYFALRLLFLHTLVGGYTAGFGASQLSGMVAKWTDGDTLARLFVPLNGYLYHDANPYRPLIIGCYAILAAVTVSRILAGELSRRWSLFLIVWFLSAAAPIFQLWGLGHNLEGARFYFFLTLPFSLLLPVLTLQPSRACALVHPRLSARLFVVSALTLAAMIGVLAKVCYASNLVWVHAGKEVRALSEQSRSLAAQYPPATKLVALGIPKDRGGAHLILNGDTFATMLRPPFVANPVDERFLTFDPIMFGPPDLVNATRLKSILHTAGTAGPFVWQPKAAVWEVQNLAPYPPVHAADSISLPDAHATTQWYPHVSGHAAYRAADSVVSMRDLRHGDGLRIDGLSLHPFSADFLQFEMKAAEADVELPIRVSWHGAHRRFDAEATAVRTLHPSSSPDFRTVCVRLSQHWRWFSQGKIQSLFVAFPQRDQVVLKDMRLVPACYLAPTLSIESVAQSNSGVCRLNRGEIPILLDGSEVSGAAGLIVEVSKANYFFENFPEAGQASAVLRTIRFPQPKGTVTLAPDDLTAAGYYQLRARCVSRSGAPVGEYSDCETLELIP